MARRNTLPPLRTKGFAWGPQRVALGISITELSRRVGINKGTLSHIESGRMVPTGAEWARVMAVLRDAEAGLSEGSTATPA
jgi:transcriptional regulator with XRE-family HTH domain